MNGHAACLRLLHALEPFSCTRDDEAMAAPLLTTPRTKATTLAYAPCTSSASLSLRSTRTVTLQLTLLHAKATTRLSTCCTTWGRENPCQQATREATRLPIWRQ